ncbi:MAG: STAS domain-containing protein [Pseudomonadota bacterium]|nr:STAS domain-containing protein [Pseudomonadota bacterium]
MSGVEQDGAAFELVQQERSRVLGALTFATVAKLLPAGTAAIAEGAAALIDLEGVTTSDSSGLALLIEWMSVAKQSEKPLRYENMPAQLHQLALLSDVDELLSLAAKSEAADHLGGAAGLPPGDVSVGASAASGSIKTSSDPLPSETK